MWGHRIDWLSHECGGSGVCGLDLRIPDYRWGSTSDPGINGHLHYPKDIDRSLNESVVDKIRKYHTDHNNNRPNVISLMSDITSTSGRIHLEFVCLPFLLVVFSSQFKSKITLTHHTHKPLVY